ncbi:hypothetical protein GYW75_02155 [Gilliamella sp. ESL0232]|uniref:hypothetical protein n=1 Tax=unclassified Gilliamella TaxID=2685620 RepID=UPI001580EE73|nr:MULTISPECIES: hypothetical protein [unclassified Gilliamella]MCO6537814.1 hypothetical protein [Gilliamella sp.]NUE95195.1 hypothetical protein [Gilliamella sp. ESL0232]
MSTDNTQVNFSEFYEIRDWLVRNGYSGTKKNWKHMLTLAPSIKKYFNKGSSAHLTWQELDEYHAKFLLEFIDLEFFEELDNK